jgi:SAM-dependent methyltransferase
VTTIEAPTTDGVLTVGAAYDAVADHYDCAHHRPIDQAENRLVQDWLAPRIMDAVMAGDLILDLGCGTGWLLDQMPVLAARPLSYLGVDLSERMLARLASKHPGFLVQQADFMSHADLEGTANLVLSLFGVPSYAGNIGTVLPRLCELVAPHGTLLAMFYTPRYSSRASYILRREHLRVRWWGARVGGVARIMARLPDDFHLVRIDGLNAWGDRLSDAPGAAGWLTAYLRLERSLLAWSGLQDQGYFLLVEVKRD